MDINALREEWQAINPEQYYRKPYALRFARAAILELCNMLERQRPSVQVLPAQPDYDAMRQVIVQQRLTLSQQQSAIENRNATVKLLEEKVKQLDAKLEARCVRRQVMVDNMKFPRPAPKPKRLIIEIGGGFDFIDTISAVIAE